MQHGISMLSLLLLCLSLFATGVRAADPDPIRDFVWRGKVADKVGSGAITKADGAPDLCFQALLTLPTPTVIDRVNVYLCDKDGNALGEYWVSRGYGPLWILGVFANDALLNTQPDAPLGTYTGHVLLDLHACDSGRVPANSFFRLDVYVGAKRYTKVMQSGAPS
jgi:hypothetical protein